MDVLCHQESVRMPRTPKVMSMILVELERHGLMDFWIKSHGIHYLFATSCESGKQNRKNWHTTSMLWRQRLTSAAAVLLLDNWKLILPQIAVRSELEHRVPSWTSFQQQSCVSFLVWIRFPCYSSQRCIVPVIAGIKRQMERLTIKL